MFHYVYITTNLINGHQYVGDRTCVCNPEKDKYLGSGALFEKKVNEYGHKNFQKKILELFDTRKEAFNAQSKYINQYNTSIPNGYNISPTGGYGVKGWLRHTDASKLKISKIWKNRKHKIESKLKMSENNSKYWLNKEFSDEHKIKLGNINKNKKRSIEAKEKMSNACKGKTWEERYGIEEATKRRNSLKIKLTGKKLSEETKLKISQNNGMKKQRVLPAAKQPVIFRK